MNRQSMGIGLAVAGLLLSCSWWGHAQKANPSSPDFQDAVRQSNKAAHEFQEMMNSPDHGIPHNILEKAQCVLIFPTVLKAAFIVGAEGGRGVATCRTSTGWSSPAFFHIDAGSWGAQVGADATNLVLLVMNRKGMDKLESDNLKLGADASLAVGPWGRQAGASTDAMAGAEILSYSRSKGAFIGVDLSGAVVRRDKSDTIALYGPSVISSSQILDGGLHAPSSADALPKTLMSYSRAKNEKGPEQGLRNQPAH